MKIRLNFAFTFVYVVLFSSSNTLAMQVNTVIQYSDLPTQINNEFVSSGCTVDCVQETIHTLNSQTDLSYMNAVTIERDGYENWLVRYTLDSASNSTNLQYDTGTNSYGNVVSPYTGYIWLELPKLIDFNATNIFRLYTDQTASDPSFDGAEDPSYNNQSTFIFGMEGDDVISGGASKTRFFTDPSGVPLPDTGNLELLDFLYSCVECDQSVTLNLIGFDYFGGTSELIVNPADTNALLFSYDDSAVDFDINTTRDLYVQSPVPVPAAVWLFSSGLLALIGVSKRKT